MIAYENNSTVQQYIDRVKDAGEIVRKAKHEILGIGEKALMSTEEAVKHIEVNTQQEFILLSEKLSKSKSNAVCDTIIATIHLAMNHPELINDIEYAIRGAMKKW